MWTVIRSSLVSGIEAMSKIADASQRVSRSPKVCYIYQSI